jgi:sugar phosphate isomerase/epimerase
MRDLKGHLELCAVNTATLGFQEPLHRVIDAVAAAGFGGIAPWRREVEGHDVKAFGRQLREAGLKVTGYCRSTYIPSNSLSGFANNINSNKRALDDAATLGAETFVMVVGGLPTGSKNIAAARRQVSDGVAELLVHARGVGVKLALEPLHPVYAAERSTLTLLSDALAMCDAIEGVVDAPMLGTCLDVYHLWWDPNLANDIARAGKAGRIFGFHVCDWLVPTQDILNDRGMMGDGIIDVAGIRTLVEAAGYQGLIEAEIFSAEDWWKKPMAQTLSVLAQCFQTST